MDIQQLKQAGFTDNEIQGYMASKPSKASQPGVLPVERQDTASILKKDYGLRADSTKKGPGFLGELRRPSGGVSTEVSIGVNLDGEETEIPGLVPTLTKDEINHLLGGGKPTPAIVDKAVEHARERRSKGKGVFLESGESAVLPVKQSDISRQLKDAGFSDQEISGYQEKVGALPVKPGVIKSAATGLTGGTLRLAESIGTGLRYAGAKTGIEPLRETGEVIEKHWEAAQKPYAPHPSIEGSILEKPELLKDPTWWAYNVANIIPSFAASIIPAVGTAKWISIGGKALKFTPQLIDKLAKIGGAVAGGVTGGGLEGASTYKEIIEKGGSEEDAARGAELMTLASAGLNTLSVGKAMTPGTMGRLKHILSSAGVESVTEYLEEPAEAGIKYALGYATPEEIKEQLKQGVNVIPPTLVTGGLGGAVFTGKRGALPTERLKAPKEHEARRTVLPVKEVQPEKEIQEQVKMEAEETPPTITPPPTPAPETQLGVEPKIPKVSGLIYNGVQKGFEDIPDQYVFTDKETKSTFYTQDLSKESLIANRDRIREKFRAEETPTEALPLREETPQPRGLTLQNIMKSGRKEITEEELNQLPDVVNKLRTPESMRDYLETKGITVSELPKEGIEIPETGKQPTARKPWEMSKKEIYENITKSKTAADSIDFRGELVKIPGMRIGRDAFTAKEMADEFHKRSIKQALSEGKPVPSEVLKDYPDLLKAEGKVEEIKEITIGLDKPRKPGTKFSDITRWVIKQGGVKPNDPSIDPLGWSRKQGGPIGLISKKARYGLDELATLLPEAGFPEMTTDELSEVISNRISGGKALIRGYTDAEIARLEDEWNQERMDILESDLQIVKTDTKNALTKSLDDEIIGMKEEWREQGISEEDITRAIEKTYKTAQTEGIIGSPEEIRTFLAESAKELKPTEPIVKPLEPATIEPVTGKKGKGTPAATTPEKPEGGTKIPIDRDGNELISMDNISMNVNPDGTISLYHRTSSEKAEQVRKTGIFKSLENTDETFFSNKIEGQAEGYGDSVIAVKVKPNDVILDDAFHNGEIHVAVSNKRLSKRNILPKPSAPAGEAGAVVSPPQLSPVEKDQYKLPGVKIGVTERAPAEKAPSLEGSPLMKAAIKEEREKAQPTLPIEKPVSVAVKNIRIGETVNGVTDKGKEVNGIVAEIDKEDGTVLIGLPNGDIREVKAETVTRPKEEIEAAPPREETVTAPPEEARPAEPAPEVVGEEKMEGQLKVEEGKEGVFTPVTPQELQTIRERIEKILPEGTTFDFVDELWLDKDDPRFGESLKEWAELGSMNATIPGQFRAGGITRSWNVTALGLISSIEVATKGVGKGKILSTAYHEAWHSIRPILSETDMAVLERRYTNKETEADAFAQFSKGKDKTIPMSVRKVFDKVRQFFEEFGNYLRGLGFNSVESIFGRAYEAMIPGQKGEMEVARREAGVWTEEKIAEPETWRLKLTQEEQNVQDMISSDTKDARTLGEKIKGTLDQFYTDWVNQWHLLEKASREMGGPGMTRRAESAIASVRLATFRAYGMATTFLEKGIPIKAQRDGKLKGDLKFEAESIQDIFKSMAKNQEKLEAWKRYAISLRAIEKNEQGIETGIDTTDAEAVVQKYDRQFRPIFDRVKKFQDALLDYYAEDMISPELKEKMKAANAFYIPFYRAIEGSGEGTGAGLQPRQVLKRMKGSEAKIIDPIESIVKNTYWMVSNAEKNSALKRFFDFAQKSPHGMNWVKELKPGKPGYPIHMHQVSLEEMKKNPLFNEMVQETGITKQELQDELVNIFRPFFPMQREDLITFYDQGKRRFFEVDPVIGRAMHGLDKDSVSQIIKLLSYPTKWLRAGAILSPEFQVRNPTRDWFSAMVYSRHGFNPWNFFEGLIEGAGKTDLYYKWLMAGGSQASFVSLDRDDLKQTAKQLLAKKRAAGILSGNDYKEVIKNLVTNPIEALRVISELGEMGTRLAVFERTMAKVPDTYEGFQTAAMASREATIDFGRIGAKAKAVNMLIAFWNANVQGLDKLRRELNFIDPKNRPNAMRAATRAMITITLPSLLLAFAFGDDDRIKEIPDWQKTLFWLIPIGDTVIRIPKPFELGIIFGSIPERIVEFIRTNDPKQFEKMGEALTTGSMPGVFPTAALPFIENWANKSMFTGRPLVPRSKEELLPQYQYQPYTTEIAKQIGNLMSKIPIAGKTDLASPAKIENFVKGWSGGLGTHALRIIDSGLASVGIKPEEVKPSKTLADIPMIKAFIARYPASDAQSIQEFYEKWGEVSQTHASITGLVKEGKREEAAKLLDKYPNLSGLYKSLNQTAQSLRKMHQLIDKVYAHPGLTPKEKRKLIDEAYLRMILIARTKLDQF